MKAVLTIFDWLNPRMHILTDVLAIKTRYVFVFSSINGLILFACGTLAAPVNIELASVGHANNAGETQPQGTFGGVGYNYKIAIYEVTNAQYVEFLNSVAADDPLGLYNPKMSSNTLGGIIRTGSSGAYSYSVKPAARGGGYSYGKKPVVFVSWYDAARFVNWLHNGQVSGNTETGTYTFESGLVTPTNGLFIRRNPGATWVLPSEDEWYKAAYYDGSSDTYFDFPTRSNTGPNNNAPLLDTGNSANFRVDAATTTGDSNYPYTDVGAYQLSLGPFGTSDQAGNVTEWTETLFSNFARATRGGSFIQQQSQLASLYRFFAQPSFENEQIGFRVALVPEPALATTLFWVSMLVLLIGRQRSEDQAKCAAQFALARCLMR